MAQDENRDISKMHELFVGMSNFSHLFSRQLCKNVLICAVAVGLFI